MLATAPIQPTTAHFSLHIGFGLGDCGGSRCPAINRARSARPCCAFALQSVGGLGIWDSPHIAKTGKLLKCTIDYRDVHDANSLDRASTVTNRFVMSPLGITAPEVLP